MQYMLRRAVYPWAVAGIAVEGLNCTASPFVATFVWERDPEMIPYTVIDRVDFYKICQKSLKAGRAATGALYVSTVNPQPGRSTNDTST